MSVVFEFCPCCQVSLSRNFDIVVSEDPAHVLEGNLQYPLCVVFLFYSIFFLVFSFFQLLYELGVVIDGLLRF